jgi:tRNA(Ile)-lysidine synthase
MLLYPLGFNHYQIERLSDIATSKQGRSGEFVGRVFLSTTHKLLVDRKCMIMEPIDKKEEKSITMPETGIYRYDDNSKIKLSLIGVNDNFEITRDKNVIFLDYNKLSFPLKLNHYVSGDRFVPFGMKGSKLVSDFLTDQKKSRFDKERQLVLRNGNGDILWVVGNRPDNRYRILNSTTEVLKVSWIQDF